MKERWLTPKLIKESEQNNRRRDSLFSGFITLALLAMLWITYYAKHLLKIPILLCFLILTAAAFVSFIKNKSLDDSSANWSTILRRIFKVIVVSLTWILLLNKLL